MGLIPSLQCRVCLCLYHPECVDGMEFASSDEYVCKVGTLWTVPQFQGLRYNELLTIPNVETPKIYYVVLKKDPLVNKKLK